MSIPKVYPNLSAVNPEDVQQLLRDLADCKKLLANERQQCAKLRAENQALRNQLDEANQRWMFIAVPAMRQTQLLREELLKQQDSLRHRRLIPAHHIESLVLQ